MAQVSTDLGGTAGSKTLLQFEFFSGIETSLAGTFDLAAGNQNNYATCAACVHMLTVDSAGTTVEKHYFQSGGTLVLTADPTTSQHLTGTITDLTLVEVTIDSANSYTSTPVAGGACVSLGTMTLNAGPTPASWTCTEAQYGDGATCDCACGAHDPDCDDSGVTANAGCAAAQVCDSHDKCIGTCQVNAPVQTCTTGTCGYSTATQDVCYSADDADLIGATAIGATCGADPLFCAVTNSVATGVCDHFGVDDLKCRTACDSNADCATGTEVCQSIFSTPVKGLCVPKTTHDTCSTASALVVGTAVTGTTAGATNDYNLGEEAATCAGFAEKGNDVTYAVTLTAGTAYTVTLSAVSPDYDPSVALFGPGLTACSTGPAVMSTCVKGADAGAEGADETFTYTPTATGVYYVIVDGFSATRTGSYTLKVTQ